MNRKSEFVQNVNGSVFDFWARLKKCDGCIVSRNENDNVHTFSWHDQWLWLHTSVFIA